MTRSTPALESASASKHEKEVSGGTGLERKLTNLEQLAMGVIDELAIPAVAEHLDMDQVVERMRRGMAEYVEDLGVDKAAVGSFLGRSTRWVYQQQEKDGVGGVKPGRRIVHAALRHFLERYPASSTAYACTDWMNKELKLEVKRSAVTDLLEIQAALGILEKVEHGYVARQAIATLDSAQQSDRVERAIEAMADFWPLLKAYVLGEGTLVRVRGQLTDNQARNFALKCRAFVAAEIANAVKSSIEECLDEPKTQLRDVVVVLAVGHP